MTENEYEYKEGTDLPKTEKNKKKKNKKREGTTVVINNYYTEPLLGVVAPPDPPESGASTMTINISPPVGMDAQELAVYVNRALRDRRV